MTGVQEDDHCIHEDGDYFKEWINKVKRASKKAKMLAQITDPEEYYELFRQIMKLNPPNSWLRKYLTPSHDEAGWHAHNIALRRWEAREMTL
jgi:hypothetical protein